MPPLNNFLVRDLIQGSHVAKMLDVFRYLPLTDMDALESLLLRVSEMVCELPTLVEMKINLLLIERKGVLAADARFVVEAYPSEIDRYARMAIYPYPTHLVSHWQRPDGSNITIRPIRPEDAELTQAFVRNLSEEARYFRYMSSVQELSEPTLVRFTQIDYSREMALIAVKNDEHDKEIELGVTRYVINPDGKSCEFALVVADHMRGTGLGLKLMVVLMDAARARGLKVMEGVVFNNNTSMLKLVRRLGFSVEANPDDDSIKTIRRVL